METLFTPTLVMDQPSDEDMISTSRIMPRAQQIHFQTSATPTFLHQATAMAAVTHESYWQAVIASAILKWKFVTFIKFNIILPIYHCLFTSFT